MTRMSAVDGTNEKVSRFILVGNSKCDPVKRLRLGDKIFFKNAKVQNNHPIYKEAIKRRHKDTCFDFYVEEVDHYGVKGMMLTCTSTIGNA